MLAGDWIKVEEATLDKPEVLAMAEMLGTSADDVLGKLLRVWFWFDKQSLNGDAPGVTNVTLDKFIDRHVAAQGFAQTMRKVGWLGEGGLPNFDRHNGETAKNRALTKKRMKKMRDAEVTETPSPEKRREEKKETTTAAPASAGFALPAWVPKDCWDSFVEMRQKVRAPLTKRGMSLIVTELEKLRASGSPPGPVLEQSVRNSWKGVFDLRPGAKVESGDWRDDPRFKHAQ